MQWRSVHLHLDHAVIVALHKVTVRVGPQERFGQVLGDGRCSRCGHVSALDPCNRCAGEVRPAGQARRICPPAQTVKQ